MPNSRQQFLVEGLVLALQVQHRYRLGCVGGVHGRDCGVLHAIILSAAERSMTNHG
jgi:hypothetical protein